VEVAALVTTVNRETGRAAMHDIRGALLDAQAVSLGLPLWTVPLPWPCSNENYIRAMSAVYEKARACGIGHIAFGDLHLADVRAWREQSLADTGITPLFPLWGLPTAPLAREMVAAGLDARIVAVDTSVMPRDAIGRSWDAAFLDALPPNVDPCGENGEFHTFVCGGPMFRNSIPVTAGALREEGSFLFADLLPG
jgi:uncharacterized protein (TIGR00290 family)